MKVVQENKRQFFHKVRSLWRKQIFVYLDEEFAINEIGPKFQSLLMTGKFRRDVFVSKEYSQVVNIPLFRGCAYQNPAVCKSIKYRIIFECDHL